MIFVFFNDLDALYAQKPIDFIFCSIESPELKSEIAVHLIGTFIVYAGGGWLNVVGYLVLTAGFSYCFYKQNLSKEP